MNPIGDLKIKKVEKEVTNEGDWCPKKSKKEEKEVIKGAVQNPVTILILKEKYGS